MWSALSPTHRLLAPRTSRRPQLISFYGPLLHGFHRGCTAKFAEPMDVWLAALSQAVPFYKNVLITVPSDFSDNTVKRILHRARQHFPSAHIAPLHPTTTSSDTVKSSPSTAADGTERLSLSAKDSTGSSSGTLSKVETAGKAVVPTSRPPLCSLGQFGRGSLDLIVFASDVFREEMYYNAPRYISAAHAALRDHGVLAVFGQHPRIRVAAPRWAGEEVQDFMDLLEAEAREEYARLEKAPLDGALQERKQKLKRLLETEESGAVGHGDIFFPFSGVHRRWFTSEFSLSASQLVEGLRGLPLYQWYASREGEAPTMKEEVDFVTVEIEGLQRISGGGEEAPVGVVRRPSSIDPLEALHHCLEVRLLSESTRRSPEDSQLRVQVDHFVVTCSNRSMSVTSESDGLRMPRLTRK